jgi:hypothetical protein
MAARNPGATIGRVSPLFALVHGPAGAAASAPAWLVRSAVPEVSWTASLANDRDVSFDGVRTSATTSTEWRVGVTLRWTRPLTDEEDPTAVRAARQRLAMARSVEALSAERSHVPPGVTLRERVYAALQVAEIDARLAAL